MGAAKAAEAEDSSDEGEQVERPAVATAKPSGGEYQNKGKKARLREKKRLAAEAAAGVQANEAKAPQKGGDKAPATKIAQGNVESDGLGKKRSATEAAIPETSPSEKSAKRRKKMRPKS